MFSSLLQKTGLSPGLALHSTISKMLMAAAMLGGAGSLLSAGSAQATSYQCEPLITGGPGGIKVIPFTVIQTNDTVACGDKLFTVGAFDVGPNLGSAVFEWFEVNPPAGYLGDKFSLNLLFAPSLTSNTATISGFFDYTLAITDPSYDFKNVQLDSAVAISTDPLSPGNTVVTKDINGIPILTSINGAQVGPVPLLIQSPISVSNKWTVAQFDTLTAVKDTYQQQIVPGPLPVMGAGMAFGFSRRLRNRIKASKKA